MPSILFRPKSKSGLARRWRYEFVEGSSGNRRLGVLGTRGLRHRGGPTKDQASNPGQFVARRRSGDYARSALRFERHGAALRVGVCGLAEASRRPRCRAPPQKSPS